MEAPEKEFVYQLTDWQNRLFGYLVTLLGSVHDAHDVLQETNLVLWQKMSEFEPGTEFGAWAKRVAYFQALAFLRDRKRDRHLFDDEVLEKMAAEPSPAKDEEELHLALRNCLSQLPEKQRELLSERYQEGGSIRKLARVFGKKESALKMRLMRIRQSLLVCIESKLKETTA